MGHYNEVKLSAEKWLDEFLAQQTTDVPPVQVDPWERDVSESSLRVNEVWERIFGKAEYDIKRVSLIVTAYSLLGSDDPRAGRADEVKEERLITSKKLPIYCIKFEIRSIAGRFVGQPTWRVSAPDGSEREYVAVPMKNATAQAERRVAIFLAPP
jgi:hypothetical protein